MFTNVELEISKDIKGFNIEVTGGNRSDFTALLDIYSNQLNIKPIVNQDKHIISCNNADKCSKSCDNCKMIFTLGVMIIDDTNKLGEVSSN